MNRNQVRKLNMFMVLWSFLNSLPQTIIALMPHFEEYFNDFKVRVALLDEQNNLQTQNTLVYRSVKINKRELVVNDVQRLIFNVVAAVDYEENLIKNSFSNVMFQNQMTFDFLNKIKSLLLYTIESNLVARNWFNYTVHKYYNKHNN